MKSNIEKRSSVIDLVTSKANLSRVSKRGRIPIAAVCASLVTFAAVPQAQAAKINDSYDIKEIRGSLEHDGGSIDIPDRLIKELFGSDCNDIVISKRRLELDKDATVDVVEEFADDFGIDVDASVSGPAFIKLRKDGDKYIGRASSKIVTEFEASILGADFEGVLKTKVLAKVEKKNLKIVIKFSGEAEGEDFSGRVVILARR